MYALVSEISPGGWGTEQREEAAPEVAALGNELSQSRAGVRLPARQLPRVAAGGLSAFMWAWYEKVVDGRRFQFEWDEAKADANVRKHGVSFELASTVFFDPGLLTVADVEHGESEERWFSVGFASNGVLVSVVYVWSEADPAAIKIRLISSRRATQLERQQYQERL